MLTVLGTIEYAGFTYEISREGEIIYAIPTPGQHRAAYKEKHRRAAIEAWHNKIKSTSVNNKSRNK